MSSLTPRIFLTDYGSYNEGRQFEFGHWLDLDQFSDYEELSEYISNHFKECDQKSPLYGGIREEIMITDFEGFPRALYWEGGNLENIMKYLQIVEDSHLDAEIFEAYLEYNDVPDDLDNLQEEVENAYYGKYDNKVEFAEAYFEHVEIPEHLPFSCIDWEAVANQIDHYEQDGHYFLGKEGTPIVIALGVFYYLVV